MPDAIPGHWPYTTAETLALSDEAMAMALLKQMVACGDRPMIEWEWTRRAVDLDGLDRRIAARISAAWQTLRERGHVMLRSGASTPGYIFDVVTMAGRDEVAAKRARA